MEGELRDALPLCAAASPVVHVMAINLSLPSERSHQPSAHAGPVGTLRAWLVPDQAAVGGSTAVLDAPVPTGKGASALEACRQVR